MLIADLLANFEGVYFHLFRAYFAMLWY
uniref:Uncharacterized protein n=1 Tax=Rhizophora mucronata TaxID=61149 RepID=A0A2P2PV09_RHIMU